MSPRPPTSTIVRADSSDGSAAQGSAAPGQDQCSLATQHVPVRLNAKAAQLAAHEDTVPLNTQGYNYNAYDDQWRPDVPTAAPAGAEPAVPAAPAKP